MLSKLTIKNVALIESAEIEFSEGLNVLSGETGAGKSVILDSVNFVLGAKADRTMIRHGETECAVRAEFLVSEDSKALEVLRELDIDSDGEIIISRKLSDAGKNSIKLNGNAVTASMLRQVTDCLVDVHGQSEHFFLLKESNQLKTLDSVIGQKLTALKAELATALKLKKEIEDKLSLLGGDEKERNRRLEILRFQIDEIGSAELCQGEEEELLAKREKINNVEKIMLAMQEALNALTLEMGALDAIRTASRAISSVSKLDESYEKISERLEDLGAEVEDVSESLSNFADGLYFDQNEAEMVEERLDLIRSLKRKYGANIEEIQAYYEACCDEFDLLSDSEEKYADLNKELLKNNEALYAICKKITALRKKEGEEFCIRVVGGLKDLNIPHARFEIAFNDYNFEDIRSVTTSGMDTITFLFSANAGEELKPLGRIISGGEMSRFMLAIKTQLSNVNEISTYIFDEIDAGISGKTAKVVGEKLAQISRNTQIIAVSHLVQIAAMCDSGFYIEKQEDAGRTVTNVHLLDEEGKIAELVRLLGGELTDEYAQKHAKELLKQAKVYKETL